MASIFERLKQRQLVQWTLAYLAGAWVLLEILAFLAENFGWPCWIVRSATLVLAIGILAALVIAWYHGAKGQQRASGIELLMLASLFVLAGGVLWWMRLQEKYSGEESGSRAASLRASPVAATSDVVPSIAVLPFVNMSPDAENEYFSDGMTEELITALSKVKGLKVAARTSAFAFKGKNVPVNQIGAALGVATVLEGSVRKARDRVRITAQLVSSRDGYHLWSEAYDRELKDVFAVQREIAKSIVSALQIELGPRAESQFGRSGTANLQAYQLYLQGRYFWNKRTPDGLRKAIDLFELALKQDPQYAHAYAGLADVYTVLPVYDRIGGMESCPRAEAAAKRALQLDSSLAEPYASLATIRYGCYWDWTGAEAAYRHGLQLDPNYATLRHWYAEFLAYLARFDDSIMEFRRAVELDPLSLIISADYGWALYTARRHDEAATQFRRTIELDPTFRNAHLGLGATLIQQRDFNGAVAELRRVQELAPGDPIGLGTLACAHVAANDRKSASEVLVQLESRSRRVYVTPSAIARGYSCLGDHDRAMKWLERALQERDPHISEVKVEPLLDPLRGDARFIALLRRMRLSS